MKNEGGGRKMSVNNKRIPLLHFPEYSVDDNSWGEKKIGDTVKTISPPVKLQSNEFKKIGKYPIVDQSQKYICGYSDDSSAVIPISKDGCVVFGDHTCALKYIDFPFIQGADGIKILISNNTNAVSTRYLYQFLNAFPIISKEYKRHFSELKEKIFLYPLFIDEQDKIADCLFAIDSCIASINEKIEQLKAHKKGLMQKLFPQNGQTVPKYRFPEFESAGMWKNIKFNDVFSRITERNTKNCRNVLTISAQYGLVSQYDYFHKNIAASDISNYYLIQKGDFAYNKSRSQGYPFGAIRSLQLYNEGVVSTLYICFRIKSDKYSVDFFDHYFETELINAEIGKIAQEGARNHGLLNISTDDFFNKTVVLVPSPSEQKKIADFLSSIDRAIFFYAQKALLLEQQKKGLTQQLFPTL